MFLVRHGGLRNDPALLEIDRTDHRHPLQRIHHGHRAEHRIVHHGEYRAVRKHHVDVVLPGELLRNGLVAHQALAALLGEQLAHVAGQIVNAVLHEIDHERDVVVGAQNAGIALFTQIDDRNAALGFGRDTALFVDPRKQSVEFGLVADRQQQTAPHNGSIDSAFHRRKEEKILFHVDTRFARILQQGEQVLLLLGGEVLVFIQFGLDPDIKRMLVQIAGFALLHQRCGIDRHGHKRVCGQDAAVIRAAAAGNNQHGRRRKAGQLQRS